MGFYRFIWPLLRRLDPERAHNLALRALSSGLLSATSRWRGGGDDPRLATRVWGLNFANPLGIAAGFDKDAQAVGPLADLGFGLVEVGSITPRPQPGNPRPRLFRLEQDRAIINRLGFNSQGHAAAEARLDHWRRKGIGAVLGVNLGKNKESAEAARDYAEGARRFGPLADYLVINVSSPNTPGLRALQGREQLAKLLEEVSLSLAGLPAADRPPLVLKIAPDLVPEDLADIVAVALESDLQGMAVSNTTLARPATLKSPQAQEAGGLSGRPLFRLSTEILSQVYRQTAGKIPLIGIGGIASGADAYLKVRAGASLVQLYSALIYGGPELVGQIKRELSACLARDGFARIADAVGADHRD